jgi:opacity protein-like surface antigen
MSIRRTIFGAALLIAGATGANAADLNGGSMKDGGYAPAIAYQSMPSWYLRGDFGWASYNEPFMFEPPNYHLSQTGINNTWSFGGGVGYYFSKNVRADLTLDWFKETDAHGSVLDPAATFQGRREFGLKSMVGLVNVYYDFDLRSRFTPYIGVGLGFAKNETTSGIIVPACPGVCVATIEGAKETNAAGALMAGFSAKLRDRLHLDAGYRFLYLGNAHTGPITGTVAAVPTTSPDPKVEDIMVHQFRVGVRWDIK